MELLERRQLLAANPPQVLEVRWSPNVEQASQIEALRVQLDSPVQWNTASFDTSIEVFSLGLGQNVSFSTSTGDNATGSYLDVSFEPGSGVQTGDIASVITDGGFEFIIHADALTNVDAQTLDGNGDGIAGDAFVFDSGGEDRFAFRYGDFDGNGSVNLLDFAEFRRVFGTTIDPGSEETYFDANLDGQVNLLDFARFRTAFGQTTSYGSIDNVQLDEPLAAGVAQSINISTLATGFDGGAVHRINGQLAVVDEPVPVVGGTARLTNDGNVELTMDGSVEGEFGFGITFSDGMTSATAQISGEVVSADVVTADSRIEVFEDHSYAFWEPDFPYVARFIGDTMESVEIVSLPEGNLLFDESPVTAGSIFSAADIAAGRLTYLPNSGPEGNQDAEFRFRVSDGVAWSGEGRVFIEVARSRYDVTDQIITQTLTPIELLDGETITRLGIGDQVGTEVSIENYTLTFDDDDIPIATFDENVEPFSFDVDLYNDDQLVRTLTLHMLPSGQAPMVRSDAVVVQRGSSMQLDLVANDPADNPAAVDRIALIHPLDGSEVTAWSDQGIALAVTENVVSVTASDSMLRSEHRFVLRYFNEQGVYRDAPLSVSVTEPAVTLDAMPDSITLDAGTFQLLDVLANDTSDSGTLNTVGVGRSAGGTFSKSLVDDGLRVEVRDGQILVAAKGTAAGRHNLYYAIDGGGSDQAIASLQIQINELDVAGYYGEVFFFNDSLSSRIPLPENASNLEVLSFYETDPELFAPGGTALQTSFGRVEINQNEIAIAERYEGDPASVDLVVGYLLDGQQQTNVLRLTHLGDLPAIEDVVLRFDQRDILIDVVPESLADQAIWLPSGIRQTDGSFASALVNGPVTATIESDRLRFVFDETASSFTDFEVDVSLLSDGGIQTIVNVKVRFELVGNPIITTLDSFNLANDVIVSTNLDVLSNDDPGDADEELRIVGIATLSYGSFTSEAIGNGGRIDLRSDGTLDFTRTSGRSFNDWFYYQVVDDGGNEAIGWMQIIAAEDILQSDTYEIDFDQTESTFDPLSNDDLPAGSTLTGIRFGGTAYQTQIENDLVRASIVDGQLLIENLGNRIGTIPIQYEITSPAGLNLHAGSVSVSILPAGTPPTLVDDTFTLSEGAMVMDVDVLSNDDSGSSGALEIISLGPFGGTTSQVGNYGRVTLQPDGTLQYVRTHALSFGTDTFSYRAQNAGQHEAFANVQFVTTHPLTEPDSVEIDFDGETVTIDPLANDSLPDGFSVTGISSSFSVGNGDTTAATASWSAELVNGEIEITNLATLPTTSTLYYRIENSAGEFFARPTIPVSIVPVGQPAVANDDTLEITEVGLSFPIDVLANDDAIEPTESLQIIGVARYSGGPLASTQMGSFGSLSVAQDETLVYQRSSATAFGTDTFFYQSMDDGGNLATAQVSVTTNESLLNEDAIVVSLDELEGRFDLLENDFLPSGFSLQGLSQYNHPNPIYYSDSVDVGPVSARIEDGDLVVEHDGTQVGQWTLYYAVEDSSGNAVRPGVLNVSIDPIGQPAVALDDHVYIDRVGIRHVISVTDNDDSGDVGESFNVIGIGRSEHSTSGTSADGSFGRLELNDAGELVYQRLATTTYGVDTFYYRIRDAGGNEDVAQVQIETAEPLFGADRYEIGFGETLASADPLANDLLPAGYSIEGISVFTYGTMLDRYTDARIDVSVDSDGLQITSLGTSLGSTRLYYYAVSPGGSRLGPVPIDIVVTATGLPPNVQNDTWTFAGNAHTETFDVLANDDAGDPDDVLTLTEVRQSWRVGQSVQGNYGLLEIEADGNVRYTRTQPTSFGTDIFTYSVIDGGGNTATAVLSVVTTGPALVQDNLNVVFGDDAVTFDPIANDQVPADFEVVGLRQTSSSEPENTIANDDVQLSIVDGQVRVLPLDRVAGSWTFYYQAGSGGDVAYDHGVLSVTISPLGQPAVAVADTRQMLAPEIVASIDVLSNDSSGDDGESLTLLGVRRFGPFADRVVGQYGWIEVAGDGSLTYTRTELASVGTDWFEYQMVDEGGNVAVAAVSVQLQDRPLHNDDITLFVNDDAADFDLLGNDNLPDGFTLTGISASPYSAFQTTFSDANLEAEIVDGQLRLLPLATHASTRTLYYQVTGGGQSYVGARADISIHPAGNPPILQDDAIAIDEAGLEFEIDLLANDDPGDPDDSLMLRGVSWWNFGTFYDTVQGTFGTLRVDPDGSVIYRRTAPTTFGTDVFYYQVNDEGGHVETAQVSVTTTTAMMTEDTVSLSYGDATTTADLLGNDAVPDGFELVSISQNSFWQQPSVSIGSVDLTIVNGQLSVDHRDEGAGSWIGYYWASDGSTTLGPTRFTVNLEAVGNAPILDDDAVTMGGGVVTLPIDVLANDDAADPEDSLRIIGLSRFQSGSTSSVVNGSYGTLHMASDGMLEYTRTNATATGTDNFYYKVIDEGGYVDSARISITITDPLLAADDVFIPLSHQTFTIDAIANDLLPDGFILGGISPYNYTAGFLYNPSISSSTYTATIVDGVIEYKNHLEAPRTQTLFYMVTNPATSRDIVGGRIQVTTTPSGNPPTASDDSFTMNSPDRRLVVDVLANDDPNDTDQSMRVSRIGSHSNPNSTIAYGNFGQLRLGYDGVVEYSRTNFDQFGTETFYYEVTDGGAKTDTASMTITVSDPLMVADFVFVDVDQEWVEVDVLANDSFDASATVAGVSRFATHSYWQTASNDDVELSILDGKVFARNRNANGGTHTMFYSVSDDLGSVTGGQIVINAAERSGNTPVPQDDIISLTSGILKHDIDVLSNDDPGNTDDSLTIVGVSWDGVEFGPQSLARNGLLQINATGGLDYTRVNPGVFGTDRFYYQVRNQGGHLAIAEVSITSTELLLTPDDIIVPSDQSSLTVDLLGNDLLTGEIALDGISVDFNIGYASSLESDLVHLSIVDGELQIENRGLGLGTHGFFYRVSDDQGDVLKGGQLMVSVVPVGDPSIANDDVFEWEVGEPNYRFDVLDNDVPGDGDRTITISGVSSMLWGFSPAFEGQYGTLQVTPESQLLYTPFSFLDPGPETFFYEIVDSNGHRDTAALQLIPRIPSQPGTVTSITGNVFLDHDEDGARQSGPGAVPFRNLEIIALDHLGHEIARTLSGSDGRYRLSWDSAKRPAMLRVVPPAGLGLTHANSGIDDSIDSDFEPLSRSLGFLGGSASVYDIGLAVDSNSDGVSDTVAESLGWTQPSDVPIALDSDGDGLNDLSERWVYGTLPSRADTDGDDLSDLLEIFSGLSPFQRGNELDSDRDRVPDALEDLLGTLSNRADSDGDLLPDGDELLEFGSNPLAIDTDLDGLSDFLEFNLQFDPRSSDSDGDGILDIDEQDAQDALGFRAAKSIIDQYYAEHGKSGSDDPALDTVDKELLALLESSFTKSETSSSSSEEEDIPEQSRLQLSVGDLSGSHSERYKLFVGNNFVTNSVHGTVESFNRTFDVDQELEFRVEHVSTNLSTPDLDWRANITFIEDSGAILHDPDGLIPGGDNEQMSFFTSSSGTLWTHRPDMTGPNDLDVSDEDEFTEGYILSVNADDDDENGVPDFQDPKTDLAADDDLFPFELAAFDHLPSGADGYFTVDGGFAGLKIWRDSGGAIEQVHSSTQLDFTQSHTLYFELTENIEAESGIVVRTRTHVTSSEYQLLGQLNDKIRLRAAGIRVFNNGYVSVDDPELYAFIVVPPPAGTDEALDALDGETVTFEIFREDGSSTGVTQSGTITNRAAYVNLTIPDSLMQLSPDDPSATTYEVRATYNDDEVKGGKFSVFPGTTETVELRAEAQLGNRSFSFDPLNPPSRLNLRDFAGGGTVTVEATLRDRLGNFVVDDTSVVWYSQDDGFLPDDFSGGESTVAGRSTISISADRIAPVARLGVIADTKQVAGYLNGGEVTVSLVPLDTSGRRARDLRIDLDDRWFFASRSETVRFKAIVRYADGSAVGAGVPVRWFDSKGLLKDVPQDPKTDSSGVSVVDLYVNSSEESFNVLGKNIVRVSVAGVERELPLYIAGSIAPPVELRYSNPVLSGDVSGTGTLTLPDADGDTPIDATETIRYSSSTQVFLRNLDANDDFRIELTGDTGSAGILLTSGNYANAANLNSTASGTGTFFIGSNNVLPDGSLAVDTITPHIYDTWLLGNTPVGYSVAGGGSGELIIGSADAMTWLTQTTGKLFSGAVFGGSGLDASLVGDVGLSLIPGLGAWGDIRDLGINAARLLPIDIGLGPFDWRETAIAGFGLLTEILPPADAVVDAYRALYKISKASAALAPFFLAVEPLFTQALQSLWNHYAVGPSGRPGGADEAALVGAVEQLRPFLTSVLGDKNVKILFGTIDLTGKLVSDADLRRIWKTLSDNGHSDLAKQVETLIEQIDGEHVADLLRAVGNSTSALDEFGEGLKVFTDAMRRLSDQGDGFNDALLAGMKGDPTTAAEVIRSLGRSMKKYGDAGQAYGSKLAKQDDLERAVMTMVGRVHGTSHHMITNVTQLKQFADDIEEVLSVGPENIRKSISLIRRLRSDSSRTAVGGQSGYLFEITEVARELRAGSVDIEFSRVQLKSEVPSAGGGVTDLGKTDLDLVVGNRAIELKTTVGATGGKSKMIPKLLKYYASGAETIEVRTLDDAMEGQLELWLNSADVRRKYGEDVIDEIIEKLDVVVVAKKFDHPGI